jgi:hypothetical protein
MLEDSPKNYGVCKFAQAVVAGSAQAVPLLKLWAP